MTQPKRELNYDIQDCSQLKQEIDAYQSNKSDYPEDPTWERYVINRSVQLGCTGPIPDDWMMEQND